jgi:hypothetical protein
MTVTVTHSQRRTEKREKGAEGKPEKRRKERLLMRDASCHAFGFWIWDKEAELRIGFAF